MVFQLCKEPNEFLKILPLDWQEFLEPFWDEIKPYTACYVMVDAGEILAGGLVFSKCPPDMLYAKSEANEWLELGYKYLGFIFVKESFRNRNLGSLWLKNLKATFPEQNFWLTIEDFKLDSFYTKNDFKLVKKLNNEGEEEGLYVYEG